MTPPKPSEPLWFHEPWPVALSLLFLPPVGLLLLWTSHRLSRTVKAGVSGFVLVTMLFVGVVNWRTGCIDEGITRVASWEAFYRARGLFRDDRFAAALPHVLRAQRLNPASRRIARLAGHIHEGLDDERRAELAFRAACGPTAFSVLDWIPRIGEDRRRLRRDIAQALLGSEGEALLTLVEFLLRKERPIGEIDAMLDRLAAERLCDTTGPRFSLARARLALRQKRFATARRFARQVVDAQEYGLPTAGAYEVLAGANEAEGRLEDALRDLAFAIRHAPSSPRLLARAEALVAKTGGSPVPWRVWAGAMRLCRAWKGTEQALPLLRKIWASGTDLPFRPLAMFQLGIHHYDDDRKEWTQAAEAFEKAASLPGEHRAKALYFLARSRQQAKANEKAREAYAACLDEAPPASHLARWSRHRMKELEES